MTVNEKTVTRRLRAWFDAQDGVCHKAVGGPMSSGFPDLMCCIDGRAWVVEAKAPGSRAREPLSIRDKYTGEMREWLDKGATLRQATTLKVWKRAGAVALVATCIEDLEKEMMKDAETYGGTD